MSSKPAFIVVLRVTIAKRARQRQRKRRVLALYICYVATRPYYTHWELLLDVLLLLLLLLLLFFFFRKNLVCCCVLPLLSFLLLFVLCEVDSYMA